MDALVLLVQLTLLVLFVIHFLPTIIAAVREHHDVWAIFVLNVLLGWTVIGWVAALVWACRQPAAGHHDYRAGRTGVQLAPARRR